MDISDPVVQTAVLGKQAEDFLGSDLGKYLIKRAEQEASEAIDGLRAVEFYNGDKIREFQAKLWRAESFQQWLGNAIVEGQEALKMLEDGD